MKPFYAQALAHLLAPRINFVAAACFYITYPIGVALFAVLPTLSAPLMKTFFWGCLLGFIAYGTYDFTNHATLKAWPLLVTVTDLAWGSLVTGTTALISRVIITAICR